MTTIQQFIQNAEPYWTAYTEHLLYKKWRTVACRKVAFSII
ncbi:putative transcription activator [Actinobacillus equuli]|nr:putative transcription activator [Actinobacillus equuli]